MRENDSELALERFDASGRHPAATPEVVFDSLVEAGYACLSCYWRKGERSYLPQAISRFSALTERTDNHQLAVMTRLGLGEAYLILADCSRAAAEYRAALDLNPQAPYLRGVAQFELGCALYTSEDHSGASSAFDAFLGTCAGETLGDKDNAWKATKPGYAELAAVDAERANKLSSLDLVSCAVYLQALCTCFSKPKRGRERGYDLLRKHFCDPDRNRGQKYDCDDSYLAGGRNAWWGPFWTGTTLGRDSGLGKCPQCRYDDGLTTVLIHKFLHFDDRYWYAFVQANKIPRVPYTGEDPHTYYNSVARVWMDVLEDCLEWEMKKCCK